MLADALKRLSMGCFLRLKKGKMEMMKDIHQLTNMEELLLDFEDGGIIVHEIAKSSLCVQVKRNRLKIVF